MEKKCGKTMKGLPVSERPYEKVLEKGPASLSDAELLSVILRSGTKNIPVREMAEEILNSGNPPGLAGLLHGAVEDYKEIRGVGEVKAIQLACVGELSARIWKTAPVSAGAAPRTAVRRSGMPRRRRWRFPSPENGLCWCLPASARGGGC